MRITMMAIGSTGDVRPFIILGKELTRRGHQVTIAAFSRFAVSVKENNLSFFPVNGDAEAFMESIMQPDTNGISYIPRFEKEIRQTVPSLIRDFEESCREAEALVCNFFGTVFYSIAEKYGIPCIQTYYFPMDPTPDMPISSFRHQNMGRWINKATYRVGYLLIGTVEKRYLSLWRSENNLTVRKPRTYPDYRIGNHTVPVIYALSSHLIHRPPEWPDYIHMSGFWFEEALPAGWVPPADLEAFLSEGDPPLYIGFGSMSGRKMNRLFAVILRALHATGIRAVISTGWQNNSFSSTRQVFFTGYIPHDWLFPRVRAVIHHGGCGTTAAGLRFGRPTLIIPFAGDQPFWGYHVYHAGCGPKPIPLSDLSVAKLTKSILNLVNQRKYQENAARVARLLASENGTKNAADIIEKEITAW